MARKELRTTSIESAAHEHIRDDYGDTDLERALVYFLDLVSNLRTADDALFVCGQIREACVMKLHLLESEGKGRDGSEEAEGR
jgi:hypothetical protein